MPHAGEIRFSTKIDNAQAQKDLDDLNRKIRKANEDISRDENAKLPLTNQARELEAQLDKAINKLDRLKAKQQEVSTIINNGSANPELFMDALDQKPELDASIKEQEMEVSNLQKKWDSFNSKIDKYDQKINQARESLEALIAEAGKLSAELSRCEKNKLPVVMDRAKDSAKKFETSIIAVGKRLLVFSVISATFRAIKTYMDRLLKTNAEYTAELANLKGALATAFQPIYEILLPGLITAMRLATAIVRVIAHILSFIAGKTGAESAQNAKALNKEADAIAAVGGAAKKASKDLAGFDEINRLGGTDAAGGGGASVGGIAPDFDAFDGSGMTDVLAKINEIVLDIGFAFLTWKVVNMMPEWFQGILGVVIAIGGALLYAANMREAFLNGFDWENLTGMVGGLAIAVAGLTFAFGSVGAAVGLLVGGVGLIMVALNEFMTTGALTNEALAAIEIGIIAVGASLALFTGSWIPLALAALVGFAVAAVAKTDDVKALLQQFDNWLQGVFARDWTEVFGPVLGGALNRFFSMVKGIWDGLKLVVSGAIDFISAVLSGDWGKAWSGAANILKGCVNTIIGVINALISGVCSGMNAVIRTLNLIKVDIPSWVPSFGGKSFGFNLRTMTPIQIPYLAQGAVIPPNREFLAVLGDQSHGTNIEAPLSTIQEAVAIVMEDMALSNAAGFEAIVAVLQRILEAVLGIEIGDDVIGQAVERYNRERAVVRGG